MKLSFKKAAVIIAAAAMTLSIYSCKSDTDNKNSSSETAGSETLITSAGSEETTDETDVNSEKDSDSDALDSSASDSDTDEVDVDSLKYDFTGLKSEKYATILSGDRYNIKFQVQNGTIDVEVYQDINQKKYLVKQSMGDKNMTGLIIDGKMYTISSGKYYVEGEDTDGMSSNNNYKDLGFIQSGEREIDGSTYFYDEFYSSELKSKVKITVDKEGKIYSMEDEMDGEMIISELTDKFEDSVFTILDTCTEASREEVMALLNGTNSAQ